MTDHEMGIGVDAHGDQTSVETSRRLMVSPLVIA